MYTFEDLHPRLEPINGRSVAYWIGALLQPLPPEFTTARQLASAMSFHYDIEEQSCDEEGIRSSPEILFDVFSPVAPVSLAERWSPLPLATRLLGQPIEHGIDMRHDFGRPAFGLFESSFILEADCVPNDVHEAHFLMLLRYACNRALDRDARVLIVAQPGWSFAHCQKRDAMPELAVEVMRKVGYLYTERTRR